MSLPNTFATKTAATGLQLDENFNALGVLVPIPCTVAGTNTVTMTPATTNTPTVLAYSNYRLFSGVVAATNTGAVTIQVGSLTALNAYKDSPAGPIALSGGELHIGNAFTAEYDSALNSGAGGFHIWSGTAFAGGTISGSLANLAIVGGTLSVLSGSIGASLTSSLLSGNSLTISALLGSYSQASVSLATLSNAQFGTLGTTLATLTRMVSALGTLTFTVTPAATAQDQNITVPGAQVRDAISIGLGTSVPVGAGFTGFCGTLGTVTVRMLNPTASSISVTTMTIRAVAMGVSP